MKTRPVRDAVDRRPRKSACAERSRADQLLRIERMSVEERVKAALSMSRPKDRETVLQLKAIRDQK